ncbi:branched-chain amino acid ABC transporter, branched-chain amino acid-binding protein precursor [Aeropyrum pernix K1]|uniref:Branched-chain amino acid ABC transporter, branched-chain amino acid-binding protein n=1 Tax=Aeropyrum pernix (strain ATCC 700893 / DSM 11879 / JCM 9820 / NBRC 100138 / K1) TaxID=272557 RepID=Q9Y8W3_AERPE|nr:ABC transporter substrate-binding protein [Aeropyrum pernix]BAA81537.2 branched-chain amino acid ABC transporter, branched-chain amino acid-binding protein precursor [Aeropyrum pernix K1]
MSQSRNLALAAIVVLVIVIVAAVAFLRGGGGEVSEIKIGVILPLSGRLAETGADLRRGIEFAVDEINSQGGVKACGGAKLTVVYGDSAGKPETGAAEAERLISQEGVIALVGAYQSSVTKTASEVAERYQVPFINPDSTSPALTERGYKWFFRVTPHDEMFAAQQADFIDWLNQKYGLNLRTFAIIHEDTEWGSKVAEAWKKYFTQHGYTLVEEVSYHAATVTSLDSEVQKLKAANPDILLAASYIQDAILLVQTMKAQNFAPKVVLAQDAGFINPSYVSQVGKDGWYIFSREVFSPDLIDKIPRLKEVNDRYKKKYGVDLNGNSARDYTGIWVLYYALEDACKKASPSNPEEFRRALRDSLVNLQLSPDQIIMPWKGVKFDEKGQNILGQGLIVQMFEDGKYHVVYPEDFAVREPVVPFPPWSQRG